MLLHIYGGSKQLPHCVYGSVGEFRVLWWKYRGRRRQLGRLERVLEEAAKEFVDGGLPAGFRA